MKQIQGMKTSETNETNEMNEMNEMNGRNEMKDQTRGPHFVRACEIEMQSNMSQEPLYTKIYRKNAPQNEPRTRIHILCEPAQSKCMSRFSQEPLHTEI